MRRGRSELNETRSRLGLPPLTHLHGGISRKLALVATFPQLEYPREWPEWAHVVGPLMWEPPFGEVELPPGDDPLVLVAPSTSQDPSQRLLRAALPGLADAPVRVLATTNRRPLPSPVDVPGNARLVDWVSYSRTMPRCDVVLCHAGHGTVVRALASGCPVVAVPAAGDMFENAARLDWAGLCACAFPTACARRALCASPSSAAWRTRPCAPASATSRHGPPATTLPPALPGSWRISPRGPADCTPRQAASKVMSTSLR